ncbi:MAG: WD40/YVTN/BNR-like repeat-containing protein [Solirubrobacteraceae bacterium]
MRDAESNRYDMRRPVYVVGGRGGWMVRLLLIAFAAGCAGRARSTTSTEKLTVATGAASQTKASPDTQPGFDPQSVNFVSPSVGWAWGPSKQWLRAGAGLGVLARTLDGGRAWSTVPTPGVDYAQPGGFPPQGASDVQFINQSQGYVFGSASYVTVDGGLRWTEIRAPGPVLDLASARQSVTTPAPQDNRAVAVEGGPGGEPRPPTLGAAQPFDGLAGVLAIALASLGALLVGEMFAVVDGHASALL